MCSLNIIITNAKRRTGTTLEALEKTADVIGMKKKDISEIKAIRAHIKLHLKAATAEITTPTISAGMRSTAS